MAQTSVNFFVDREKDIVIVGLMRETAAIDELYNQLIAKRKSMQTKHPQETSLLVTISEIEQLEACIQERGKTLYNDIRAFYTCEGNGSELTVDIGRGLIHRVCVVLADMPPNPLRGLTK